MLSEAKHPSNDDRFSYFREVLRFAQDDHARHILLMLVIVIIFSFSLHHAEALTPNELSRIGFDQHVGQQLSPALAFRDDTGNVVTLGNYFGAKPTLLVLGYSRCPMLCTFINTGLIQSLQELRLDVGKDFNVLDVSIDQKETPAAAAAKKREYIKRYGRPGASEGWHSLVGDEAEIRQLTDEAGFRFAYDRESNEFAHPSGFVLLTPQGKISRYFLGVNFNPKELRSAMIAAAQERQGSVVQRFVLLCFHYNPITGKYGALVMNVVRVGGLLTLFAIGAGIFWMSRRSVRAPHSVGV
jgi:protein SCO1